VTPYVAPEAVTNRDALLQEKTSLMASMPSIAGPIVMLSIGGGFLLAGGLAFGLSEWNYNFYDGAYWGPGQYAGVTAMTIGGILVAVGVPLLAVSLARRNSRKRRIRQIDQELSLAMVPVFSPRADHEQYGLRLTVAF